jgi:membrane protease YdiL (CAAX protease family)
LFLGQEGLRPGWGFALYVAMFFPLQRLAVGLASSSDSDVSGLWSMMLAEFGILIAAIIPALVLAQIERRAWGVYGLPGRHAFGKLFWLGALWGFAGISLLMFSLHTLNAFDFGHIALHGARMAKFTVFWAATFLLVGLSEEFRFRGYTQFTLGRGIGFWPSAAMLSATFGVIHLGNEGEDWTGVLGAACIGLFFCLTLRRTGSLWFAVGFHAAWDWGETFFYSVPDSGMVAPGHLFSSSLHGKPWLTGGTVGPEGSVLCFVVMALTWIAFDRVYPGVNRGRTSLPLQRATDSSSLRSSE